MGGSIGQAAAPHAGQLAQLLGDVMPDVRANAAHAMGQIGQAAAPYVGQLARLLSDGDERVREQAAFAMGIIGQVTHAAPPAPQQALSQPPAQNVHGGAEAEMKAEETVSSRHFCDDKEIHDAGDRYRPLQQFVDRPPPGHSAASTCADYARQLQPHLPNVEFLGEAVEECKRITMSILEEPAAMQVGERGMIFAIVLYTFDTSLISSTAKREYNLYYLLNSMLRTRSPQFLKAAHGYLYFLMTGLSRLPPATGQLYRGIDAERAPMARAKFRQGRRLYFSSFSSATPELPVAMQFAGAGGLVLRTTLLPEGSQARDIKELSAFGATEAETLMLPNFRSVVTGTKTESGVEFIDLTEMATERTLVDF
eukprot:NODE_374_length_1621_cov_233.993614.p1 GENE.NODE_374_length_1621_cov_233.993614~~NODE_374_length_1621_cov_233.993614.p1  ORF type:complete len:367 (+),score=91.72 NODE_374_length_1621_cov_233.993614:3-1103(+)